MVQTSIVGTKPEDYCNRCFKDGPKLHYIDGVEIYLCGGCGYEVRSWTNFLRAHGVGMRRILVVPLDASLVEGVEDPEGKEGVEGGENLPANAKGRVKT